MRGQYAHLSNSYTKTSILPDARALYELIENEDPHRVAALIDKLSPRISNELHGVNPAKRDLSQIKAQVILLHGRGDTMIPYTESIAIAQALPRQQVTLFLIEGYVHTNVKPKRQNLPQLLGAMDLLMQQRVAIDNNIGQCSTFQTGSLSNT